MKSLGKTIDRLITIEPNLKDSLLPIKAKWERYPKRTENYWKQLLTVLNSNPYMDHPRRTEFRNIINPPRKEVKQLYTFSPLTKEDSIISVLPDNIADKVRKIDRQIINLTKKRVVAELTHNTELLILVFRMETVHKIESEKVWLLVKDYFNLWSSPDTFTIKVKDGLLFLVKESSEALPQFMGPGIVKMDQNTLQNFLRFLKMNPPTDN